MENPWKSLFLINWYRLMLSISNDMHYMIIMEKTLTT